MVWIVFGYLSFAVLYASVQVSLAGALIVSLIVGYFWWFVYESLKFYKTPEGQENLKEQTKAQKEYEDEFGIIDYDEKG